ncbi:uncharacterized protein N7518_001790 [Penicillium psychrosexuale]|uniref:uncharacterized protein n=1 Tax=Penicillium psychrosexuale TaxID=1002107 RepID=UPI002545BA63|nr:uncharacterized protein N7518_001790 [Penicillium psychrosexuale]KAJ5799722.1 hypothetical protein N7518_001790 [Penicillium psychrosexuale]
MPKSLPSFWAGNMPSRDLTLSGDHTSILPPLRSISKAYGPVYPFCDVAVVIHAGIRTISDPSEYENDGYCGFGIIEAREIDAINMLDTTGTDGITKDIRDRVGTDNLICLSIDIDTRICL